MNLIPDELRTAIKPDLNLIYTEKPFFVASGADFGWFCREHAFHTYILGSLLNLEPAIVHGEISFRVGANRHTTLSTDADHAWCRLAGVVPVDLSVEFRYYLDYPAVPIVQGTNESSPYTVVYLPADRAEESRSLLDERELMIIYVEREVLTPDPLRLIDDPYSFLLPPPPKLPKFTDIHGADVFDRVTMHCYKLVKGNAKSVALYCDEKTGLEKMLKWNNGATSELRRRLGERKGT